MVNKLFNVITEQYTKIYNKKYIFFMKNSYTSK